MDVCSCDVVLGNTGSPGCKRTYLVTKFLLLQAIVGSAGTDNFFDVSAGEPTLSTITAALDNVEPTDRLFPLGEFEDITDERAEAIVQEFGSGQKARVRDGARDFSGFIPNAEPILVGKVKKSVCSQLGAFMLDAGGNLIFSARKSEGLVTNAYPVRIDTNTLDVRYVKATDTTIAGVMINFQWATSEQDSYLRQVKQTDLDWGATDLYGLVDAYSVNSAITTTGFTVTITDEYGDPVVGLVSGDMTLAELSPTPGSVAITTVTESANGVYDIVHALATSGDVLELTITKSGYDFANVKANTITIP